MKLNQFRIYTRKKRPEIKIRKSNEEKDFLHCEDEEDESSQRFYMLPALRLVREEVETEKSDCDSWRREKTSSSVLTRGLRRKSKSRTCIL